MKHKIIVKHTKEIIFEIAEFIAMKVGPIFISGLLLLMLADSHYGLSQLSDAIYANATHNPNYLSQK